MKNHKEFYEEYWGYDKATPEKDPTTIQRGHLLINTLKKQKFGKDIFILDAGCGNGYFAYFLENKGYHTIGIDISNKAIKKAKALYPGIKFKVCSLEDKLFFEDKIFNVVWSTEVIEHIYYIHNYLFEINRILKLGGLFIITTPYHGLLKNLAIVLFGFDRHFCNIRGGHIRFFSNKCLDRWFDEFGFKIIEKKYIGRFWPVSKSFYIVGRKIKDV